MNLQENIQRIKEVMGINESTIPSSIRRRANMETLDEYITMGELEHLNPCDDFDSEFDWIDAVIDSAIDRFLSKINDDIFEEDYYSDVMDYLRNMCRDLFGDYLSSIYKMTCSDEIEDGLNGKQEQTESEITERCWKNYTQKGMKTMFGKKYPNCVKKKK